MFVPSVLTLYTVMTVCNIEKNPIKSVKTICTIHLGAMSEENQMELILIDVLKVAVCNTAKFGFEPIPSNYRASVAATNINADNPGYFSKQFMYFHV